METQNDPTAQGSAEPGAPAETQSQQPGADARIAEQNAEIKALRAQLDQSQQQANLLYQQFLQNQNAPQRQEAPDPFALLGEVFGEEEKDKADLLAQAIKAAMAPTHQELQNIRAQMAGQAALSEFGGLGLTADEVKLAQQTIAYHAARGVNFTPKQAAALVAADRLLGTNAQGVARNAQTQFNAGAGAGQVPPGFAGQVPQPQTPQALPDYNFAPNAGRDVNFEAAFRKKYPNGAPL